MSSELTWLGHGCWLIETHGHRVLIDPFLSDSPTAAANADTVAAEFILVSHGHGDHVADCVQIATRCGAGVIANFEICNWLAKQGVKKTHAHNTGGQAKYAFGTVKFTQAFHSSSMPDGSYGGSPNGFLVTLPEGNIYFACDTSLFGDMALIGKAGIELAVLPIGDLFTMGPDDSIEAIKLLRPKRVVPSHFNTWAPINQDTHAWSHRVKLETEAEPRVLEPGGKILL